MTKVVDLKISNFRGVKEYKGNFGEDRLICLVGRGDVGKTSILEAINLVLSPIWNPFLDDTDFFQCNPDEPIEIEASVVDFPEELIVEDKYGLYLNFYNPTTRQVVTEQDDSFKKVLTIKFQYNKDYEPHWKVINKQNNEEVDIGRTDRGLLNCSLLSDFTDKHFSWSKGTPLYNLLRNTQQEVDSGRNIVIEAMRQAKEEIDTLSFNTLDDVTEEIRKVSTDLGLMLNDIKTTIDFRELCIKENKISLHEGKIPVRLKGKGSKRLLYMAIQLKAIQNGGIILIDEVEQGLEPDRIKHLVRYFLNNSTGQIFISTHSRAVIEELPSQSLYILRNEQNAVDSFHIDLPHDTFQKVVRACPEAFFARKIIMCEGPTEVGICRSLNKFRITQGQEPLSCKECFYLDGSGSTMLERAKTIKDVGKDVVLFGDNDVLTSTQKEELTNKNISLFLWNAGNNTEKQFFIDCSWVAVMEAIDYIVKDKFANNQQQLLQEIGLTVLSDTTECRIALANISGGRKWFKNVTNGELLGDIIFNNWSDLSNDQYLRSNLIALNDWVEC